MSETNPPLQAFGFAVPVSSAGRRVWPPDLKKLITEKMDAGELTIHEVVRECRVSKSLVYQWRMQARGKPVTVAEWRAKAFAQVLVEELPAQGQGTAASPSENLDGRIHLRGLRCELVLPVDYPIGNLAQLVQAIEALAC